MSNIVIGIEGMVGAGKTSICNELLDLIPNSIFVDGSKIYRALIEALHMAKDSLKFEENSQEESSKNEDLKSEDSASPNKKPNIFDGINSLEQMAMLTPFDLLKKLQVDFKIEDRKTVIYIAGKKVDEEAMKSMQNSIVVSKMANMADNSKLFAFAHQIIQEYSKKFNLIVSARDLVKIYPEMDLHIFITASLDERVKRRYKQLNGEYTIEEVRNSIVERDILHEKAGFNETFDKTVKVDVTEDSSAKESAKKIYDKYISKLLDE